MVYITSKNEKIDDLIKQEGFSEYFKSKNDFFESNPHLTPFKAATHLPPHTPIVLQKDLDLKTYAAELNSLSAEVRERLWLMQESKIDIPTLIATEDLMQQAQKYADRLRKFLNDPLLATPWFSTDPIVTNSTLLDLIPEGCGMAVGSIRRMKPVDSLSALYEAISIRSAIHTEQAKLLAHGKKFAARIMQLEKQAQIQTKLIEKLLPKSANDQLVKYLNSKGVNVYKTRSNYQSKKMAGKGKAATLGLELLNKTGFERSMKLINGLIKFGKFIENSAFALGAGVVLYDTVQAYKHKQDFTRAFLTGSAGFATGVYLSSIGSFSAWGSCTISLLAGDAALGGLILASGPLIGTVALVVIGAVAMGTVAYGATEIVGKAWDSDLAKASRENISILLKDLYDTIIQAWKNGERWILNFYEADPYAR